MGARSPDPGTLCCLPQSWEGRPARAGHSQPQHFHPEFSPLPKCLLFLLCRFFWGWNFPCLNAHVFMSQYPALAVVAPMAEPGQGGGRRQRRPGGASSGSTRSDLGSWPTHGWSRDPPPFDKLAVATHSAMDPPSPVLKVTWGKGRKANFPPEIMFPRKRCPWDFRGCRIMLLMPMGVQFLPRIVQCTSIRSLRC